MTKSESKPIKYKTTLHSDNGTRTVVYYETPIVAFNEQEIVLDTGDWWTRSTQSRMNWASQEFKLGYQVRIRADEWLIDYQDKQHPFTDQRIRLDRQTGQVTAPNNNK